MNSDRRLYRSTKDRMLAGVCGGIAEYLDVDPTLVRLVFAALTLLSSGSGFIIYIVLMLIVPERPARKEKREYEEAVSEESASVVKSSIAVPDDELDSEPE